MGAWVELDATNRRDSSESRVGERPTLLSSSNKAKDGTYAKLSNLRPSCNYFIEERFEEMKNVRIKVRKNCSCDRWDYAIHDGKKRLSLEYPSWYTRKGDAIRAAKAMAKRIGIKFDPEIVKQLCLTTKKHSDMP